MAETASPPAASPAATLTDNAAHPLEVEVVRLVQRLLAPRWPFDRVGVDVRFDLHDERASWNSFARAKVEDNRLHGWVRIGFNYLFLIQAERIFCEHIVPHEVAHLLSGALDVVRGERPNNPHTPEWEDHLSRLSPYTPKTAHPERDIAAGRFDGRAVTLMQAGTPVGCGCGEDGFRVLRPRQGARIGKEHCKNCKEPLHPVGQEAIPEDVAAAYRYVTREHVERA